MLKAAEQSVVWTLRQAQGRQCGILRLFQAFFWLLPVRASQTGRVFSAPKHCPRLPVRVRTQTAPTCQYRLPITALVKGLQKIDFHECQVESSEPREQKNSHGSFLL